MKITIPVHSFVDVITNSSSEIFVSANKSTVEAMKDIVDYLLASQGISKRADDLFDFKLEYMVRCEQTDYEDKSFKTEKKRTEFLRKHDLDDCSSDGQRVWNNLIITPKDKNNEHIVKVGELLQNITDKFDIEESYN